MTSFETTSTNIVLPSWAGAARLFIKAIGVLTFAIVFIAVGLTLPASEFDTEKKPNLIFILADDLGFGDLGCYGQKVIKTPNLDQMAKEGMRFRNFYAGCTVCAPSRSVLMTGQHMGHTWVRGNAGNNISIQCLREQDTTVAEIMKTSGYTTALCGKWGIGEVRNEGEENEGLPNNKGFDYFYGYLNQRHAHNYYPELLWKNKTKVKLRNKVTRLKQHPRAKTFPAGYATERIDYSHDLVMDEAKKFITDNQSKPFFLYLALTIPHANNEGTKGTGDGQEVPDYGIYTSKDWPNQDKGQAAMITRMDRGIGEIMELLKSYEIDENTIVMFTSDNGHHNEGGHNPERFNPNGPLRGMKRDLYEGGIRVPLIVRWPGQVAANSISDHISYFGDLMATTCDLVKATPPDNIDSVSFVPTILGTPDSQKEHEYLYWEFYEQGSQQAVRQGPWKAIRRPMKTGPIELYNLDHDLGEAENLAESNPEKVRQLARVMDNAHVENSNWKSRGNPPKNQPQPGEGMMPKVLLSK